MPDIVWIHSTVMNREISLGALGVAKKCSLLQEHSHNPQCKRIHQITARCRELCLVLCRVWVCHSLFCRYNLFIKFYCLAYIVIWSWNKLWGLCAFSCWWRFLCKFRQLLWISNKLKVESFGKWHFCCVISFQLFGATVILKCWELQAQWQSITFHKTWIFCNTDVRTEPKVSQIRLCHHNLCHSESFGYRRI